MFLLSLIVGSDFNFLGSQYSDFRLFFQYLWFLVFVSVILHFGDVLSMILSFSRQECF